MTFRLYFEILFFVMLLSYDYWFQSGSIIWLLSQCLDVIWFYSVWCILGIFPLPYFQSLNDIALIPNIGNLLKCNMLLVHFVYKTQVITCLVLLTTLLVNGDWDALHKRVASNASLLMRSIINFAKRDYLGLLWMDKLLGTTKCWVYILLKYWPLLSGVHVGLYSLCALCGSLLNDIAAILQIKPHLKQTKISPLRLLASAFAFLTCTLIVLT